uniref:Integrase, catalytic region, zinc finger, CCHC-type, peptidase aspartic, catalytic n=1 Tax=Tanacetum cinerariifolium TaxID=118510 RepID=A0A6L2MTA4_TANCI|nr:hypothetical protein [Tanacetum cinerariifolium]
MAFTMLYLKFPNFEFKAIQVWLEIANQKGHETWWNEERKGKDIGKSTKYAQIIKVPETSKYLNARLCSKGPLLTPNTCVSTSTLSSSYTFLRLRRGGKPASESRVMQQRTIANTKYLRINIHIIKLIYILEADTRRQARSDFASWKQRIRLYCRGKDNGVNILKSIDEGPYKLGTFRETLAESTEGTPQFGPKRPRVYSNLNSKERDRGLRESNYDQLFAYLKQHEAHAKENKMVLERLSQPIDQPTADPLALLSNVSNIQHGLPSLSTLSITPLTPSHANSTDDLIENLTSTLALLTQPYRTFLPQTNNQLRTSSNPRNQSTVQDGRVVIQNVQGRPNRGQEMNPWGGNAVGYGEAQNRVGNAQENRVALDAEHLLFLAGGPDNTFDDDVDEQPVQDLALNVDNVFQAEDCDAFDSDVDEALTAQTMFMANLSSVDPITDEAGPSYDSDILSEVRDHDQYLDDTCAYQGEHVMHDSVQLDHVLDLHADHTSVSNMIPYDQYVKDIDVSVVHINASTTTMTLMMQSGYS